MYIVVKMGEEEEEKTMLVGSLCFIKKKNITKEMTFVKYLVFLKKKKILLLPKKNF